MPRQPGFKSGVRVEDDFVEADLDTAFALLADAETHDSREERAYALGAIEQAEKAMADGEERLPRLNDCDRERTRDRLTRMRALIGMIRLNVK